MASYFAYGSNCNPDVMASKEVAHTSRRRAVLRGYRLRFNKKALRDRLPETIGFANIEASPDGVVEGVLYSIGGGDLERLDRSERYPSHYNRVRVEVETDSGPEEAWAYQARREVTAEGLTPSRNYLNHILAGQAFLSEQYYKALDQSITYRDACECCGQAGEVLFVKEGEEMHTLCQGCREARIKWGDAVGRPLSVAESAAVMTELVLGGPGYATIEDLIRDAVSKNLIRAELHGSSDGTMS